MPQAKFVFYADIDNTVPVVDWLDKQPDKVQEKIIAAMRILSASGHESRRPLWSLLRDGIYELRVRHLRVQYRILCFFHLRQLIIAAHGCTKEGEVDDSDIDRAVKRQLRFKANPQRHTYIERVDALAAEIGWKGGDMTDG